MAVPRLYYVTTGLDADIAFATWSAVLSPLFEPRPWARSKILPTGSANGAILGDMIIAKVAFEPQMFVRDAERIAATPDHILLHLYLSGGFNGLISGEQASIGPGKVAVIDLAHEVRTRAFASNTLSLVVPRTMLPDMAPGTLKARLDPPRNELLAAHIRSLQERSSQISEDEIASTVSDTADFLRRLFGHADFTWRNAQDADDDFLSLAQTAIRDNLAIGKLSPDFLAEKLGISRATLYRVFAPHGGIMRYVQERRLIAVRAALSDPLETRKLSRIAADLGFNSEAHFSRAFRQRFDMTATEYRQEQIEASKQTQLTSPEVVNRWWVDVATTARSASA
ncbi:MULTISPECIES: helix-turn-helix domain-containing protein [Mesorhizobium]|uniref:helix-turn-helix domain-containing protein n=1 Tax=Mesorhizobium TaxID=68287 RepID=UPI0009C0AE88|nr:MULTISPECIES: helix-turn-helix domain-containing protein [Mesorhizobium]QKC70550.1 helix-turn-helix domain-containing protein [Mesorhizobium loti]